MTTTTPRPLRKAYLNLRRRGLTQTEARRECGISRASAWRWDKLLEAEEAQRAEVRARYAKHDNEDTLREAGLKDVSVQGSIPMPPWVDSQNGSRPTPSAEEQLPEDDSYPSGLLERRKRAQAAAETPSLPSGHPMLNRRAVVVAHGGIADPLPDEPLAHMMLI
jgi:hypothetical protein